MRTSEGKGLLMLEPTDIPIKRGVFICDDFNPVSARLRGSRCKQCDETFFPPRESCPRCQEGGMEDVPLARTGKVASITAVGRPPNHYAEPYWLAEVDLPEGVRLIAQIDCPLNREVRVGETVQFTTRPLLSFADGKRVWGYVFTPVASGEKLS